MPGYKVLICNDDGEWLREAMVVLQCQGLINISTGPPSSDESPFILTFIEQLEALGWEVR
jgi:hypothetical protein